MPDPEAKMHDLCLGLPEAEERETWERPTFRVQDKIFAIMGPDGSGRPSVRLKAPPGAQEMLVGADPERFFVPAYVGPKGWIGVCLDRDPDWSEVDRLMRQSYRLVAPKRLAASLG